MNINEELDRLRLELRDRDLEIINLKAQMRQMRNCGNCKNSVEYSSCLNPECKIFEKWTAKEGR